MVVHLLAPVSSRSVTSIALDLIPELEAMFTSESPYVNASDTPPLTQESVDFASQMFTELLPAIKETMIQRANAKQRSLGPAVEANFEKMGRIMPRLIKLFGAIATRPRIDPSLEPVLQDFTHTVMEKASETASNALNEAADQIKKQSETLTSGTRVEAYPGVPINENAVEEVPLAIESTPPVAVIPDLPAYTADALEGPKEDFIPAQKSYASGNAAAVAPEAFTKFNLKLPVPKEVLKAAQKSTDGSVYYKLPGGGFFYATGYTG
ncbi:hypothetical protein FHG87_015303 [Trinorchestia longiramus]|nr:hypothetical protein FHG87_015303 [Trinorchestia longiramus]